MERLEEKKKRSRVLIIGATGNLGFELAKASLQSSHPTYALVRCFSSSDFSKSDKLHFLSNAGTTLLKVFVRIYVYISVCVFSLLFIFVIFEFLYFGCCCDFGWLGFTAR